MKLKLILLIASVTFSAMAQTAILTDTFAGVSGTNLTAHAPAVGGSWTALAASVDGFYLNGSGFAYNATGVGIVLYETAVGLPVNDTMTYKFDIHSYSDSGFSGAAIYDAAGHYYFVSSAPSSDSGGGWILGSSAGTIDSLFSTPLTVGLTYNCTFTLVTNGTTVTLSVLVKQGASTIWNTGNFNDTSYPAVTYPGLWGDGANSASTGNQIGNLSATYPGAPLTVSPASVVVSTTGNLITLTGSGTSWTPGTPGSPTFTASAGTITAQTVNSATSAVLTFTAPSSGSVTFTDPSSGGTAVINAVAGTPVTDTGFWFVPGMWALSGSGQATAPNAGAYFYFGFTGTSATMLLNSTAIGSSAAIVRVVVDYGAPVDSNISGLSSLVIGTGLANTLHQVAVYYRGRDTTIDSWNLPADGLVVQGMQLSGGATTSAPTHLSNTTLIFTDSRGDGYRTDTLTEATGQDCTATVAFMIGQALGTEVALAGWDGQGYLVGGHTNVPPMFSPGNDPASSWNKIYSGQARSFGTAYAYIIILEQGRNDVSGGVSDANVELSLEGLLTALRAAAPSASLIVTPAYDEAKGPAVLIGFNTYQAATPDANAFFADQNLPAVQQAALWPGPGPNYISLDGVHPTAFGNSIIGASVVNVIKGVLTPGRSPGPIIGQ
jgi:lysophospholipase L1-like esterase